MTEIAVWGANEGTAPQFVHTLADAASARVDAGELEADDTAGAVGLPRNDRAISVDEPDRKFTIFFCHPSGEIGRFHDHPVDYKISAPEAPVEQNRAYETVLRNPSGILFLADGRPDVDAAALQALSEGLGSSVAGSDVALHALLTPEGTRSPDPEAFRAEHALPQGATVAEVETWKGEPAWHAFTRLAHQLRDQLRAASRDGRLPV